jgi:LssY C-terminus
MKDIKTLSEQTGKIVLLLLGSAIIITLPLVALARILVVMRKLRKVTRPGRETSTVASSIETNLTTFNHAGKAGDPINFQIQGTDGQIGAAFALAGWMRADEIDFITSARISADSLFGRAYSTAPVSNLYLYGRKEDLAFERPGHNVRQRDHIRLWNSGTNESTDGRPVWIGSATRDVKVELSKTNHLPTHGIAPDLDAERALVVSELAQTGYVIKDTTRPGFGKETHSFNGGGDPYFTDGQVVVLTLANTWTSPLAKQVRSPLLASIIKSMASIVRKTLPQAGRERAAREQVRVSASTHKIPGL